MRNDNWEFLENQMKFLDELEKTIFKKKEYEKTTERKKE